MAGYSYSWSNKKRDVLEAYEIIRKQMPLLIGLIGTGANATSTKIEWLEDSIGPRSITVSDNTSGVLTVGTGEGALVGVGTLLMAVGYPDLLKVTAVSGDSVTVGIAAAHGGSLTASTAPTGEYRIISDPKAENSSAGDGAIHQATTNYNYTQIFRKDAALSRTAIQTAVYGNLDNQINHQVNLKLEEMTRDMSNTLIFGERQERSNSALGMAGGLYSFATGTGALEIDATPSSTAYALDDMLVNDAVQKINDNGGNASVILTCPAQARVLGASAADKVRIVREDATRGTYVAQVVNALNGSIMTIVADPAMNVVPTDAWVLDPAMMNIRHMQSPYDWDSAAVDVDGVRRSILAESSFEFNNAKLRACRIKELKAAATALADLKATPAVNATIMNSTTNPVNTTIMNSTTNPVNTKEVAGS